MADLHSKILDAPPESKFFQFHAVFGKIWQNHMLAPPGELAPLLGEILYPPLHTHPFCSYYLLIPPIEKHKNEKKVALGALETLIFQ